MLSTCIHETNQNTVLFVLRTTNNSKLFFNPLYFLTAGVMFGIGPIIAQHYGAREFEQIKIKTRRFLWVALFLGILFALLLSNGNLVLNALGTDDNIRSVSLGYLTAVSYGAIPIALYQAPRNYSEGITQTKIVFMIGGFGFILNIPLNYFFIFSMDLGGIGCGIATALVSWIGLIVSVSYTHQTLPTNREV